MVYFSCNTCGQSVKKNQVEKHYQFQCRYCEVLSCVDCGKDFRGDEYKAHTKCISEDEKYGAKGAKISTNKGEVKQDQWTMNIQEKIAMTDVRPVLANLLEKLLSFENIPRKKVKFEKFVKNSLKVFDARLVGEIWDIVNFAPDSKADKTVAKVTEGNNNFDNSSSVSNAEDNSVKDEQEKIPERTKFENGVVKKKKKKLQEKQKDDSVIGVASDEVENAICCGVENQVKRKKNRQVDGDAKEEFRVDVSETANVHSEEPGKKKRKKSKKHREVDGDAKEELRVDVSETGNGYFEKKCKKTKHSDVDGDAKEEEFRVDDSETGNTNSEAQPIGDEPLKKKRKKSKKHREVDGDAKEELRVDVSETGNMHCDEQPIGDEPHKKKHKKKKKKCTD